jgi:hypothetical protein
MADSARFPEMHLTKSRQITLNTAVIQNPEIIQVATIRGRHVDEMGFFKPRHDNPLRNQTYDFLGQYGEYLIVLTADRDFKKYARADWVARLMSEEGHTVKTAHELCELIPQLFSR